MFRNGAEASPDPCLSLLHNRNDLLRASCVTVAVMSLHASGKKGFMEVMVVSDLLFLYFVLFHFVI